MSAFASPTRCTGEVTERAELLNGAMQLSLDGASTDTETPWTIELALSWRLGRVGTVTIDEGDLTLESGDREVIANLDAGTAELDPDTGNVEVDAAFEVESASGIALTAGAPIRARLEISAEAWTGELTLSN